MDVIKGRLSRMDELERTAASMKNELDILKSRVSHMVSWRASANFLGPNVIH